jgi:DeoR/GlpR family transcriptional regulator of sugar metabolism
MRTIRHRFAQCARKRLTFGASDADDASVNQRRRREVLLARLQSDGPQSVATLAQQLSVTPSTIRRDLGDLADRGQILRTYGGAALTRQTVAKGDTRSLEAKIRIAEVAQRELVREHQTIIVSSGSTALEFARRLPPQDLTVITNALDVANLLVDREGIELIVLGGVVRSGMHSMLGHLAELAARELRADTLFFGIGAVHPDHGLMNDSIPEILTDRALREISDQVVVLADSSKLGHVAPAFVFGLSEVDVLVTDEGAKPSDIAAIERAGVRVMVARAGTTPGESE